MASIRCSMVAGQVREVATCASGDAVGSDRTLFLEWKQYGDSADENAQETRTRNLASLLERLTVAEGLCIPRCLGYAANYRNYRTCLIFKHPVGTSKQLETLSRLLSSKGVPLLGDRFKLALSLATSLSAIHTSGWLHKQLSSHNVLFFSPTIAAGDCLVDGWSIPPRFIVGFEYFRPNEDNAESEAVRGNPDQQLYRHLSSQRPLRKRFCRAFDIYSLGVMLVEIGYWRPISQFIKDSYTPEKLLNHLIKIHTPRLPPKTGTLYTHVVRSCLEGALANPALDEAQSQRMFYWSVVNELERLVV